MTRQFLLWLLVAFAADGVAQAERPKGEEGKIRQLRQQFVAAINAGDAERAMAVLAADAVILVENAEAVEGREAIRKTTKRVFEHAGTHKLTMETTRLERSGRLAYELGRYTMVRQRADGTTTSEQGKYVDVWRRDGDGEWRIVVHAPSKTLKQH